MRNFSWLIVLASASFAQASFEMAVVLDQGATNGRSYFLDSGVYLGKVDIGNASAGPFTSMALLRGRQSVWVSRGGSYAEYNIWTGEQIGSGVGYFTQFETAFSTDGAKFSIFDFGVNYSLYTYPPAAANGTGGTLAGGAYRGGTWTHDQQGIVGIRTNGTSTEISYSSVASGSATSALLLSGVTAESRRISRVGGLSSYYLVAGTTAQRCYINTNGSFVGSNLSAPVTGWSPLATTDAHDGNLVLGSITAGGFGLARYDRYSTSDNKYISLTQVSNAVRIGSFLAPEPTTLVGFGAGLAALLRRKRQRY